MTDTSPGQLKQYNEANVSLIKLHHWQKTKFIKGKEMQLGKAPLHLDWPKRQYDRIEILDWMRKKDNNVGVRLGETWAVLDIDPRNGGIKGQKVLEEKYHMNFEKFARVITGRGDGGLHIYVRIPEGWRGMAKHPDIPGVDFKHHTGMQVVSAGSKHPEGGIYKWAPRSVPLQATAECPQLLLEAFTVKRPPKELAGKGSESFGSIEPEELERALKHIDPADFREHDEWLTLMMSCHWITGGEAREEFAVWSASDPEYDGHEGIIEKRWDSLSRDGGFASRVVTGAYLFKVMNQQGVGEHGPKVSLSYDFDEIDESDFESDTAETLTAELRILKDMNKKHAMVNLQGRAFVLCNVEEEDETGKEIRRIQFSQPRDMREIYMSKHVAHKVQVPAGGTKVMLNNHFDFWRTHPNRREYDHVVFDPAKPSEFTTTGGMKTLNLWENFPYDPRKRGKGDWSLLRRLIKEAISGGDKDTYEYIMNWLAFSVQVPNRPQRTALVMRGPRGVGKGTLAREWLYLWGIHGVATDDGDDLFGKYNADMEYKCGVFLDEAFWAGDKATLGKLKARITEPKFRVEQKHQPKRNARNFLKIMMASNEEHVIPAAPDDRRFQMVDVLPTFQGNREFWTALDHQMTHGGRQAMFYDLINRPLGDYDPESHRITNNALRSQVRMTYGEIAEWWIELLEQGELPFQIGEWAQSPVNVPISSLRDHFVNYLGGSRRGDWAYNFDSKFALALRRLMPKDYTIPRRRVQLAEDDPALNILSTGKGRRINCYQMPSLETCRQRARELFGHDLLNENNVVYADETERVSAKIVELTEKKVDAALDGEYDLHDLLDAEIEALYLELDGGDLI